MDGFDKTRGVKISAIPTNNIHGYMSKKQTSLFFYLNNWMVVILLLVGAIVAPTSYYFIVVVVFSPPYPTNPAPTIPPSPPLNATTTSVVEIIQNLFSQQNKEIGELKKDLIASIKLEIQSENNPVKDKLDHFVSKFSEITSAWQMVINQIDIDHVKNAFSQDIKQQVELMKSRMDNIGAKELEHELELKILNAQNIQFKQQLIKLKELLIDLVNKPQVIITILESPSSTEPRCFATISPQLKKMLPMAIVDVQQRTISEPLKKWMKNVVGSVSEVPFYIMRREVTIEEFGQYVAQLSAQQQSELGEMWQKGDSGNLLAAERPVASVPWWAAQGYAEWLSKQTQCQLELPTRNQWVAATIQYADPSKEVVRQNDSGSMLSPQIRTVGVDGVIDLLGNLREWSNESCAKDSYFLLGEDFKTKSERISGIPLCQTGNLRLDMNGFRLILKEKQLQVPNSPLPRIVPTSI